MNDHAGAIADYDRVIALNPVGREYARFFRRLAARRVGRSDDLAALTAVVGKWEDAWAGTVGRFLAGGISEDELLRIAAEGGKPPVAERECEAFYYIGAMRLTAGHPAEAKPFFERAVATGVRSFIEYSQAQIELQRLATTAAAAQSR